jgi:NAD(P)-dependent dehydrogenase (short-subunit alcohol dehydrogenase family)
MALFAGKVALVTGGSSGIGRACAIAFAREGAKVAICDRNLEKGEETVKLLREAGSDGLFIQTDVAKEADVKAMVEDTIATFNRLDYACNNAGIEQFAVPITEQTAENFDQIMNINVKGVWLGMKYQIPQMLKNGKGAIVNISSTAGLVGFPGLGIYSASKHAVLGLTKSVALEYAKSGIRVNAICPGAIETEMIERFAKVNPKLVEQIREIHPIGRFGKPEEIADAVVWLCSDKASFMTGHSLAIDGGFVVQ